MFRVWFLIAISIISARGAERLIDFTKMKANEPPVGLRPALMGLGGAPEWKIIETEVPPLLDALTAKAQTPRQNVLAQVSRDPADNRYPLLILDDEEFGNFTVTTRFKLQAGVVEQMAGIAFRMQNDSNFFYIRASGLYNNIRFVPVIDGQIQKPVGSDVQIPSGVWHELKIEAKGNQINCWLNGKQAFPTLQDGTFSAGKIGFWTKSDSESYFANTHIEYTPREALATVLVREFFSSYNRVKNMRIVSKAPDGSLKVIASNQPGEIGQPALEFEEKAYNQGEKFVGKDRKRKVMLATSPIRDKNGDVIATVRFEVEPFKGQTEKNVVERTGPIVRAMEARIAANKELTGLQ
jgi:hypothetical protein